MSACVSSAPCASACFIADRTAGGIRAILARRLSRPVIFATCFSCGNCRHCARRRNQSRPASFVSLHPSAIEFGRIPVEICCESYAGHRLEPALTRIRGFHPARTNSFAISCIVRRWSAGRMESLPEIFAAISVSAGRSFANRRHAPLRANENSLLTSQLQK